MLRRLPVTESCAVDWLRAESPSKMQASAERIASRPAVCSSTPPPLVARYSSLARSCTARVSPLPRRQLSPVSAFAPSLPSPPLPAGQNMSASLGAQPSLDPMAASWEQAWEPGRLLTVKSPEQFSDLQLSHPEKLIVLMCKSHSCRPCKMFTRKYLSIVSACCHLPIRHKALDTHRHPDLFAWLWGCGCMAPACMPM